MTGQPAEPLEEEQWLEEAYALATEANKTLVEATGSGKGKGKPPGEMAYDHEVDGGEGAPGDTESPEPAGLQAQEVNF